MLILQRRMSLHIVIFILHLYQFVCVNDIRFLIFLLLDRPPDPFGNIPGIVAKVLPGYTPTKHTYNIQFLSHLKSRVDFVLSRGQRTEAKLRRDMYCMNKEIVATLYDDATDREMNKKRIFCVLCGCRIACSVQILFCDPHIYARDY